jgi:hypothetical protein
MNEIHIHIKYECLIDRISITPIEHSKDMISSLEDLCKGRLAVTRRKIVEDPVLKRVEQMRMTQEKCHYYP